MAGLPVTIRMEKERRAAMWVVHPALLIPWP